MTTTLRLPVAEEDSPGEPDEQWELPDLEDTPGEPDEPWAPDVEPAGVTPV